MRRFSPAHLGIAAVLAFLVWASPASANPQFSGTEAGSVRVEESGTVYNIYSADRSIGAFTSFGNAAGETINSIQASASDSVIFKVIGNSPSEIFGALNANSHVFLVNPNGILFGPGSQVNAPGLVAAAMDLKSADFDSREFRFEAPASGGYVLNEGSLRASAGGYVALIGKAVDNRGAIEAPGGSAVLASAGAATVGLDRDGGISVTVTKPVDAPVYDLAGNKIADGLRNSGQISASGGRVILTADAMEEVFDQAINHTGVIEASSVENRGGVVVLSGGPRGNVGLAGQSRIDASGGTGGGTILIGGDYKGENPDIPNSKAVFFGSDAVLRADAASMGDGGKIILWSNEATQAYGTISARGAAGGSGGFVETSSKNYLGVDGARVLAGTWLLDPFNVTISGAANAAGSFSGTNPQTWTPSSSSNIQDASIVSNLNAGTSIIVITTGIGVQPGNITVNASIAKTTGPAATLTLDADGSIFLNSPISAAGTLLDVNLWAGLNIDVANTINTSGGNVDIDAGQTVTLHSAITTSGGDVSIYAGSDLIELASSITINTSVVGSGGDVFIDSSMVPTAAGLDFSIDARGLSTGDGGDVFIGRVMKNAQTNDIVNDFSVDASGITNGSVVYLYDSILVDKHLTDNGSITVKGGVVYAYGPLFNTGDDGITLIANDTILLGFLNADSDIIGTRGDVSLTAPNGVFDINGNSPNIFADLLTLSSTAGNIGSSSNALEVDYNSVNSTAVAGSVFLRGFTGDEADPATDAGVILEGNRVTGGENFEEFVTESSTATDAGTEEGADQKKEDEKKGDKPAYVSPSTALPAGIQAVEAPASFPDEKPVQPSTFQTCAV